MSDHIAPEVKVENQLIRFIPESPVDHQKAIDVLGATRSGRYVIHSLKTPSATILVDEEGRLVVHGTIQPQAARAAVREFLLRLGMSDEGITSEKGPVVASFNLERAIDIERAPIYIDEATRDDSLGCLRVFDKRHDMELLMFPNGKVLTTNARHANMVAMAAVHWRNRLESDGLLDEG